MILENKINEISNMIFEIEETQQFSLFRSTLLAQLLFQSPKFQNTIELLLHNVSKIDNFSFSNGFFGLIPEGWLKDIAQTTWKLNPRDRMEILLKTNSVLNVL